MKRTFITTTVLAFIAIVFAGCSKPQSDKKPESDKPSVVGKWNFTNYTSGVKAAWEFKPDGTMKSSYATKPSVWTIQGNALIVTHASGTIETFELSGSKGKVSGKNNRGGTLLLERVP